MQWEDRTVAAELVVFTSKEHSVYTGESKRMCTHYTRLYGYVERTVLVDQLLDLLHAHLLFFERSKRVHYVIKLSCSQPLCYWANAVDLTVCRCLNESKELAPPKEREVGVVIHVLCSVGFVARLGDYLLCRLKYKHAAYRHFPLCWRLARLKYTTNTIKINPER